MTATRVTATVEVGFMLRGALRRLLDEHPSHPDWLELRRRLTSSFVVDFEESSGLRDRLLAFTPYVDR